MNRRGNLFDGIGIVVTLFTAAVIILIFVLFIQRAMSGILTAPGLPTTATNMSNDVNGQVGWVMDFVLIMLLLALPIASMVLAFFNNVHPLFFWAGIGLQMIVIILGSAFGDSWVAVINDTNLSAASTSLPMSTYVFANFGIYSFFVILIIAAGVFIKSRGQTGYLQ